MLVLPIPTVIFQLLFLFFIVRLESWLYRTRLFLEPADSSFYARAANLTSTLAGWLIFFLCLPFLPVLGLQEQLPNFILTGAGLLEFGNQLALGDANLISWVIVAVLLTFFGTVFLEQWTLLGLEWFLRREQLKALGARQLTEHLLFINACSYSVVTVLVLLGFLLRQPGAVGG